MDFDFSTESIVPDIAGSSIKIGGTTSVILPIGTTAQRPSVPSSAMLRYNSDSTRFEGYNGAWIVLGGSGATGGGTDAIFQENSTTVTTSYTLTSGKNASCVGPLTINTGVTVTVPTGARLVIL